MHDKPAKPAGPSGAPTQELRDLARVVRAALGVLLRYWEARGDPPGHPYRQAAMLIYVYLGDRYHV